jgi:hypothetical protein
MHATVQDGSIVSSYTAFLVVAYADTKGIQMELGMHLAPTQARTHACMQMVVVID